MPSGRYSTRSHSSTTTVSASGNFSRVTSSALTASATKAERTISRTGLGFFVVIMRATATAIAAAAKLRPPSPKTQVPAKAKSAKSISAVETGRTQLRTPATKRLKRKRSSDENAR